MSSLLWDLMADETDSSDEEISPEVSRLLAALDVPVELLDFDYGSQVH